MRNNIVHFINYSPNIYSGFDKYNVLLSRKLVEKGLQPVFVFSETLGNVPQLSKDLVDSGAIVEIMTSSGKLKIIKAIVKLLLKYKPIIVHSHFNNFIQLTTAVLSLFLRSQYYVTFHSLISSLDVNDYLRKKGFVKRISLLIYYRFLILRSKNVIVVSESIKKQFLEFSKSWSPKVIKNYLGVSVKQFDINKNKIRNQLHLPEDKILLLNISAIEPIKGIDIILKAIALLIKDYDVVNFKFCHIGGLRSNNESQKEYQDYIFNLANQLNITDYIVWLGLRNDVEQIIPAFDIYLHPSRMEGIGVAIMESASWSLPIVGSNVGGIPEVVKDNYNGFIIDSESIEQLSQKIMSLLANESLRKEMGLNSYRLASDHFNIENQTSKQLNIYLQNTLNL